MPATDAYWRNLNKMHVVFFASAVAMFAATMWMMAADHSDEWRGVQATNNKINAELTRREKNKLQSSESFQTDLAEAQRKLSAAEAEVEAKQATVDTLAKERKRAALDQDLTLRKLRDQRAIRDVARADLDLKIRDDASESVKSDYFKRFDDENTKAQELELEYQERTRDLNEKSAELKEETEAKDNAEAERKKILAQLDPYNSALSKTDPEGFSGVKRWLMDFPILDGFNNPTKILQDHVTMGVKLGMTETDRFDRCRTCHINIDVVKPGNVPAFPLGPTDSKNYVDWVDAGKYPHPYATHPRPELFTADTSPHKTEKFGCTSCHDGQGSATSFTNASHTPNSPIEDGEWERKYHYHSNHFWEYPMLPKRLQESGCIKCHHSVAELGTSPKFGESAPHVVRGWNLIKKYGCFGCHEINGYDAGKPIGPDIRLEPQTAEDARKIAEDPTQVAGTMRKVGPSLRHIAAKTTRGFVETWTEEPKKFRPTTRMPQFYKLSNQQDHEAERFTPIELAGISQFLFSKSQPIELDSPADGYVPDAQRGKTLFSQKGCLACHTHSEFPKAKSDFGPNLDRVHAKLRADKKANDDAPNFSKWLYTWIRDPQRYHPRSKMPNLFLTPVKQGDVEVDPAADIAAWLMQKGTEKFPQISFAQDAEGSAERRDDLHEYAKLNLSRALPEALVEKALDTDSRYPAREAPVIKGDEIELVNSGEIVEATEPGTYKVKFNNPPKELPESVTFVFAGGGFAGRKYDDAAIDLEAGTVKLKLTASDKERLKKAMAENTPEKVPAKGDRFYFNGPITQTMQLSYVGRKTVSKYGCYGCHDIPEFEAARPIGVALQDWGRKDPSRLAPEHIHEFLHHHGEPDGGSTQERVETALKAARAGEFTDPAVEDRELSAAYFFNDLSHHGRAGFLWQKLRAPRSYDYEKIETKGFDERLKMPKFPFTETDIQDVANFVLGLVAEPPPEKFLYHPDAAAMTRVQGEILLDKYNCIGCHSVELPKFTIRTEIERLPYFQGLKPDEHPESLALLQQLKPPRPVKVTPDSDGNGTLTFEGSVKLLPDPEEDEENRVYNLIMWENLKVNDRLLRPMAQFEVPVKDMLKIEPARGGDFAFWLIDALTGGDRSTDKVFDAWQKAPPTLYREGVKVQTAWLYRFLKNPYTLRHMAVLRMPRFNMSDEEARTLANYFAAVDGATFPYQAVPEREPEYLAAKQAHFGLDDGSDESGYLGQSWKILNHPETCIKCHSVGGRMVQVDPKKPVRGPNLENAADRLRPDWTMLWIYNPQWVLPYTAMPALFSKTKPPVKELLDGDGQAQATGARDALMNYPRLLERFGKAPPKPAAAAATNDPPPDAGKEEK